MCSRRNKAILKYHFQQQKFEHLSSVIFCDKGHSNHHNFKSIGYNYFPLDKKRHPRRHLYSENKSKQLNNIP